MTQKRVVKLPPDKADGHNDLDVHVIPIAKPHEIEPVTFGDDIYDPRSESERFPMPEDMPMEETPVESRDS